MSVHSNKFNRRRRLKDIEPDEVSLVDRAANKRRFLVFKTEQGMPEGIGPELEIIGDELHSTGATRAAISIEDAVDVLSKLSKAIEAVQNSDGDEEVDLNDLIEKAEDAVASLDEERDDALSRAIQWAEIIAQGAAAIAAGLADGSLDLDTAMEEAQALLEPLTNLAGTESMDDALEMSDTTEANVDKKVPDKDASAEEKREAQKERSEKYHIEVLENEGERLSFSKGMPTSETLYGDPVNLKFPLEPETRARNARARFKQFADTYELQKSKEVVHERIVKRLLDIGANPSFDPNDPLDKLLSSSLKEKLQKRDQNEASSNRETTTRRNTMQDTLREVAKRALVLSHKAVTSGYSELEDLNNVTSLVQGLIAKCTGENAKELELTELSLILNADKELRQIEKSVAAFIAKQEEETDDASVEADTDESTSETVEAETNVDAADTTDEDATDTEADSVDNNVADADAESDVAKDDSDSTDGDATATADSSSNAGESTASADDGKQGGAEVIDLQAKLVELQAQVGALQTALAKARGDVDDPASNDDNSVDDGGNDTDHSLLFPINYNDPDYKARVAKANGSAE